MDYEYNDHQEQSSGGEQPQSNVGRQVSEQAQPAYRAPEMPQMQQSGPQDRPYAYHYGADPRTEGNQYPYTYQQPAAKQKKTKQKKQKTNGGLLRTVIIAVAAAMVAGAVSAVAVGVVLSGKLESQLDAARAENTELRDMLEDAQAQTQHAHTTASGGQSMAGIYNRNVSAVVGIANESTSTNIFGQTSSIASTGSGFIISEDGYIVSNYHVIADAQTLTVTLHNGEEYQAEVIGYEATNDVALLKIDAEGLTAVEIGDSDVLQVGDQVAAIGNPLGELTFTMTVGYVSALDREINTDGTPINMLQTDVAINSGNSGGPLFDMNGNVVGITTAKFSGSTSGGATIEGIGFAIPIKDAMKIAGDLKEYGYVTGQAYLGVNVMDMDAATAEVYSLPIGAYVDSVVEGTCAERAGLKSGDIIIAMGQYEIESYTDLVAALKKFTAGDSTTLVVFRGGAEVTLNIILDEKPREEQQQTQSAEQGEIGPQQEPVPEEEPAQPDEDQMPQFDEDMMEEFFHYFFGRR